MFFKKIQQELIVYRFIDAYLDFYGEFKVPIISKQFQIKQSIAKEIVTKYQRKRPRNLTYDPIKKKYVKGAEFEKMFLVNESSFLYLDAIKILYTK